MASVKTPHDDSTDVFVDCRANASAPSKPPLERLGGLAAIALAAALQFGLTACGDSRAAPGELASATQVDKSSGTSSSGTEPTDPTEPSADTPPTSVTIQNPSLPTTPQDPQPTEPAPQDPVRFNQLRILPLGDSMTAGNDSVASSFRSYRGALYNMLRSAGHDVDFVGTLQAQPAVGGDPDHNGYGGAQIGPGGSSNNLSEKVAAILGAVGEVDVIVLALGWNSAYQEPSYAAAKYEGLVRQIGAMRPGATLVLATLSPQRAETEQQTSSQLTGYSQLNAKARELANSSTTDNLILADLATAGFRGEDYWDVIHWLQSGADKAARVMFDSLTANASIVNAR